MPRAFMSLTLEDAKHMLAAGEAEATAIFRRIYEDGLRSLCLHDAHLA